MDLNLQTAEQWSGRLSADGHKMLKKRQMKPPEV
jgi:hypothetical protein